MHHHTENLIIGAGPAGLAVAARLGRKGIPYTSLEREQAVAPAWRRHYDRLHLHTVKELSALPFLPFPDTYPRYVPRTLVVAYFERYAEEMDIRPLFGQEVVSVAKRDGEWITTTADGTTFTSRHVVVATGFNRKPHVPRWEGMESFQGYLKHSVHYRNGKPFEGQDVLVVGMGNTGAEIAIDLYEHGARPFISVRGPVNIVPRDVLGRPTQRTAVLLSRLPTRLGDFIAKIVQRIAVGDLSQYGLETPKEAPAAQLRRRAKTPVIDVGTVALIREGKVKILPGVDRFEQRSIVFENGIEQAFDAVILATGYRPAVQDFLEDTSGLLNEAGYPRPGAADGRHRGLFFIGFDAYSNGILNSINRESEAIAAQLDEAWRSASPVTAG